MAYNAKRLDTLLKIYDTICISGDKHDSKSAAKCAAQDRKDEVKIEFEEEEGGGEEKLEEQEEEEMAEEESEMVEQKLEASQSKMKK